MTELHRESLEEAATHVGGEARMLLPGVQTILGFQLMAVFNQRFEQFTFAEQVAHFVAFLLVTLTMGLLMAPAAYHRQAERCGRATVALRRSNSPSLGSLLSWSSQVRPYQER